MYKEKIYGHRVIVLGHFINYKFFYACNAYSRSWDEGIVLKTVILEKYTALDGGLARGERIALPDTNNNKMIITDAIYFNKS